jgi:elongation factor Ts
MADIPAALVMKLREATGAGMMDCKRALVDCDGDFERAKDRLRQTGAAKAEHKAGRSTNEGVIEAYVHAVGGMPAKVGVLVEVNCESDFVAKTDDFKRLARELALQVAGAEPLYVRPEDVPAEIVERERNVFRAQVEGKPEAMVEKIVEGKLAASSSSRGSVTRSTRRGSRSWCRRRSPSWARTSPSPASSATGWGSPRPRGAEPRARDPRRRRRGCDRSGGIGRSPSGVLAHRPQALG